MFKNKLYVIFSLLFFYENNYNTEDKEIMPFLKRHSKPIAGVLPLTFFGLSAKMYDRAYPLKYILQGNIKDVLSENKESFGFLTCGCIASGYLLDLIRKSRKQNPEILTEGTSPAEKE